MVRLLHLDLALRSLEQAGACLLLNALGIIDQSRPLHDALFAAWGGRVLQLIAGLALIFGFQQRVAALALAGFLVPATLVAHPFWLSIGTPDLQVQLVNAGKILPSLVGFCSLHPPP